MVTEHKNKRVKASVREWGWKKEGVTVQVPKKNTADRYIRRYKKRTKAITPHLNERVMDA
jgi:hypothetical protein